ncbi:FtsX-like permease family protein [Nannocystis radixulma]|uniref:ABC3 transporter permease C-terminal domain-containing protein n=1 Tax=Nannocystis radixulma TaxID=2995305 RepID=A0ABT5BH67_9BACT|nr:FtsX-like permease family protein [Nannocystis radixulma]MDC0673502.1 hypothetical protein [Nannocystis radixulma]
MFSLSKDLRMLARSPTWVFVAIFTLALAIGANVAIFSAVEMLLTLEPLMDPALAPRGFIGFVALLGVLAGLALMLAAVGLYAAMADTIIRRTHELRVRMASGAPTRADVALVARQSMILAAVGLVLGVLGALGLARLMTAMLACGIPFVSLTPLLVVGGLVATYSPARRVTRRHE